MDFDFTKIDPALFAPAVMTLTCAKTGASFTHGEVNNEIIKSSVES